MRNLSNHECMKLLEDYIPAIAKVMRLEEKLEWEIAAYHTMALSMHVNCINDNNEWRAHLVEEAVKMSQYDQAIFSDMIEDIRQGRHKLSATKNDER